jgi:hypothetical protein
MSNIQPSDKPITEFNIKGTKNMMDVDFGPVKYTLYDTPRNPSPQDAASNANRMNNHAKKILAADRLLAKLEKRRAERK